MVAKLPASQTVKEEPRLLMEKHKILIESGFGSYLLGKKPKAVGNEFLYYEPSLLLWVDEIICDKYALQGERNWAEKGYLTCELFTKLRGEGIVKDKNFEGLFQGRIKGNLLQASEDDSQNSKEENLAPTSMPDPENIEDFRNTGFYDINSMLFLSSVLNIPYLDVDATNKYYRWKLRSIVHSSYEDKEVNVFSQILDIYVPNFELFPKNNEFIEAENSTRTLHSLSREYCTGKIELDTYKKGYLDFLDKWQRYDNAVRNQVLENFEILLDLRKDGKFRSLRNFISKFSENITQSPGDEDFQKEVGLRFKKEILEIEREIAEKSTTYNFLDKCASYISFPIEVTSLISGATASYLTQNPFFLALSSIPSGVKWVARGVEDMQRRNIAWYFYLLDFKNKVDRRREISLIEEEIRKIEGR